jgi:hypothetical protein
MKKFVLVLSLLTLVINVNAQFLKKLNLEDRLVNSNPSDLDEDLGFSSDREVPSSFTLEDYAVVSNQKESSSCTGFAISGALTIMYNHANEINRYSEQLINRFDPFYLYGSLKDLNNMDCISGNGCDCGSYIYEGLDLIENYGCKKWYLTPDFTCSSVISEELLRNMTYMTNQYSIDGYTDLLDYEKVDGDIYFTIDIDKMKSMLSASLPIIGGVVVGDNFSALKTPNVLYSAELGESGRHAITIVGYNDNYKGGAFRVLNSYGSDWGDDGFFWITYEDFMQHGDAAYVMWIEDNWDSFTSETYEKADFYKGPLENDLNWEGPMNSEGNCNGRGILTGETFSAYAYYDNGSAQGTWYWFEDGEDGFWGSVTYDNGTVISEEEWGFSSNQNQDAQINLLQIDNMDINISEEANDDDFTPRMLDRISNNSSVSKKTNFNFNKTNNYNKH